MVTASAKAMPSGAPPSSQYGNSSGLPLRWLGRLNGWKKRSGPGSPRGRTQFTYWMPCLYVALAPTRKRRSSRPIAASVPRIDGKVASPTPSRPMFGDSTSSTRILSGAAVFNTLAR